MKKTIILFFAIMIIFTGCSKIDNMPTNNKENEYRKSVWITYYELSDWLENNEDDFIRNVDKKIKEINSFGFNTVTVQVRPCADAFYNSKYFPKSIYQQKGDYDVLKIICDVSNKYGINVEAWINPYRVSQNSKINENGVAYKWYKSNDNSVVKINNKIYFNPAFKKVNKLIVNGVKEIVENYNIAAIHFDDYFYPEDCGNFDNKEYKSYKNKNGKLSLKDWRRNNVTELIKEVSKAINKRALFGISPASNMDSNYNNIYADIERWIDNNYIDYVCPQIYFGFKNEYQPFMFTVKKWNELCNNSNVDLYVGLPLYKAGKLDEYASNDTDIQNEFINNQNIIQRQINFISKLQKIKGYYIFSYSSLFDEKSKNEVSNLLEAMQDNNQV